MRPRVHLLVLHARGAAAAAGADRLSLPASSLPPGVTTVTVVVTDVVGQRAVASHQITAAAGTPPPQLAALTAADAEHDLRARVHRLDRQPLRRNQLLRAERHETNSSPAFSLV